MEYTQSNETYPQNQTSGMATAAFILSIVSIATFCCIYAAIICASLACVLAFLSRGGNTCLPKMAKVAVTISIIAVVLTIIVTTYSFFIAISAAGSLENFFREYNYLYEQLYGTSSSDLSLLIRFR